MDPNQDIDNFEDILDLSEVPEADESSSVDDFIKELEAKERDLHITSETTFIEIAEAFEDYNDMPEVIAKQVPVNGHKAVVPPVSAKPGADSALLNEIAELKGRLAKMDAERTEIFENSHRRTKDFEALKARTERERIDTFSNQISNLAVKMLPALDNLDRALDFASVMPEEKRNEFQQFFDGIVLVSQQINEVLSGMGIEPILTAGRTFDPHFHEAVSIDETSELPPNTVSEELLRGYRIGEKVIRHSMVKVTKSVPADIIEMGEYGEIDFTNVPAAMDEEILIAAALEPAETNQIEEGE